MTDTEKLNKINLLNNARQIRYYALHKDRLNSLRREIYAKGKAKSQPIPEPASTVIHKTDYAKVRSITYDQAVNALDGLGINANTASKYKQDLKRLLSISNCDNLITCFRKFKTLIKIIDTAKKPDGTPYAINTKKSLIQMILYLIDNLHLPITKAIKANYISQFDIYKISSNDENREKQDSAPIYTFKEYLAKVKTEFGAYSKIFVLASLYNEITLRDDFQLIIVPLLKEANDTSKNYIVMPKKNNLTIMVNTYKTSGKFGQIIVKLSLPLSKMIRGFIQREKLEVGNYLFGDKKLSDFVSKANKQIDIQGSISLYRQMSVSDLLSTEPSAQARQELAASMKHSPVVQQKYLRANI